MEQRQGCSSCVICGDELRDNRNDGLCRRCEDAWEREVDSEW